MNIFTKKLKFKIKNKYNLSEHNFKINKMIKKNNFPFYAIFFSKNESIFHFILQV